MPHARGASCRGRIIKIQHPPRNRGYRVEAYIHATLASILTDIYKKEVPLLREIYLDNAATTPVKPEVADLARQVMEEFYGNPSSLHRKGLEAQLLLEKAREQMANALGCLPEEVYFTSGATEANNIAIQGAFAAHKRRGNTLISTAVEHSSVRSTLQMLSQQQNAKIVLVDPQPEGNIDPDTLCREVTGDTLLLSCNLVNSEVGAVSDLAAITRQAKRQNPKALVHTDGVQALGKVDFSLKKLGVDLASFSGHKLHAPKGVGALYIKKGVRVLPLFYGGGQEKGLRPGTESVPLACALGAAAQMAKEHLEANRSHFEVLRSYYIEKSGQIPGLCMNMPPNGAPNICNISVPGYRSETMIHFLAERGIYVSGGSACSKGADSHVLTAMGLPRNRIKSALRVSFSPYNTLEDIDHFFTALAEGMNQITRSND